MRRFETSFKSPKSRLLIGILAVALAGGVAVVIHDGTNNSTPNTHTQSSYPAGNQSGTQPGTTSPSRTSVPAEIVHKDITATMFWVGEAADSDNGYIANRASAWQDDWQSFYGGVDDPNNRCGYDPCAFKPKENPFYVALPFNDYDENGNPKPPSVLKRIPWYTGQPDGKTSLLKNHWVEVTEGDKTAYLQWEDVGPFGEDDVNYVFGTARPHERSAGIDLSPAADAYLHNNGEGLVSWRFVDQTQVPAGPWRQIITTSGIQHPD